MSNIVNSVNPFAFRQPEDVCQKYHDAFYVDVMAEVSPMKALSATISQMALEPLEYLGQALGKFIHGEIRRETIFLTNVVCAKAELEQGMLLKFLYDLRHTCICSRVNDIAKPSRIWNEAFSLR